MNDKRKAEREHAEMVAFIRCVAHGWPLSTAGNAVRDVFIAAITSEARHLTNKHDRRIAKRIAQHAHAEPEGEVRP